MIEELFRARPRLFAGLVYGVLIAIAIAILSGIGLNWLHEYRAETKRAKDRAKIEELEKTARDAQTAAAAAAAREEAIQQSLELLQVEHERTVAELAGLLEQRKQEGQRYVSKRAALDRITDYDELRLVDCELRSRLGYDCAEALPRGTTDRPDGPGTRAPQK